MSSYGSEGGEVRSSAGKIETSMPASSSRRVRRVAWRLVALLIVIGLALAIPVTTPAPAHASQGAAAQNPEFLKAADEVLQQMSVILHLPIKQPLKKSLRSKQEIRAYLIQADKRCV